MAVNFNDQIIKEFRENKGVVGGPFEGKPVLILHTTGARSGQERVNPLMYRKENGTVYVFASKGGAPTAPDWYHNLKANPGAKIEIGEDEYPVEAKVLSGEERDRVYKLQAEEFPQFAEYQQNTSRQIPVVALTRAE